MFLKIWGKSLGLRRDNLWICVKETSVFNTRWRYRYSQQPKGVDSCGNSRADASGTYTVVRTRGMHRRSSTCGHLLLLLYMRPTPLSLYVSMQLFDIGKYISQFVSQNLQLQSKKRCSSSPCKGGRATIVLSYHGAMSPNLVRRWVPQAKIRIWNVANGLSRLNLDPGNIDLASCLCASCLGLPFMVKHKGLQR